jgi:hypothetical protein
VGNQAAARLRRSSSEKSPKWANRGDGRLRPVVRSGDAK